MILRTAVLAVLLFSATNGISQNRFFGRKNEKMANWSFREDNKGHWYKAELRKLKNKVMSSQIVAYLDGFDGRVYQNLTVLVKWDPLHPGEFRTSTELWHPAIEGAVHQVQVSRVMDGDDKRGTDDEVKGKEWDVSILIPRDDLSEGYQWDTDPYSDNLLESPMDRFLAPLVRYAKPQTVQFPLIKT